MAIKLRLPIPEDADLEKFGSERLFQSAPPSRAATVLEHGQGLLAHVSIRAALTGGDAF